MTTATSARTPARLANSGFRQEIADGLIMTWRNLKRVPRIPELWIFAILQSIMFVLLFAYVFTAWAALIALLGVAVDRDRTGDRHDAGPKAGG